MRDARKHEPRPLPSGVCGFRSVSKTQDQSGLEQEIPLVVRMAKENPNGAIASSVARPVLLVGDQTIAMELAPRHARENKPVSPRRPNLAQRFSAGVMEE
jgi:hypothetical protein